MGDGGERAGGRWRGRALVALALIVAGALTCAWIARLALAEKLLLAELARRGATPAALHVTRLDRHGIAIEGLTLGPPEAPDLELARLEVSWSFAGLRARRLDALALDGLRVRGAQGEDGVHFGAAEGLWRGAPPEKATRAAPPLLPASSILLRDSAFELDTRAGTARGRLEGHLESGADGAIDGAAELALEHPLVRARGSVALSGTLADLEGDIDLALRDAREPARVAPAVLRGRVSGRANALRFDVTFEGAGGKLRAGLAGHADLGARDASADLRLAPIRFEPKGLQPQTLVPALEAVLDRVTVSKVSGEVSARGTLALRAGVPACRLDVTLRDIGFESRSARVSGAAGSVALRGPPWQTPAGQRLTVARLDIGVPLSDGVLEFRLRPGYALDIRRTTWRFAGGELSAQDVALALGSARTELRMRASGLALGELLALVSLEGVDGSGRIDGDLPFVRADGALRVEGGVLRASGGGEIRYRPSASIAEYAASRPNDLGLAVAALGDFHYEALEARIDGDVGGELHVELHLRGANPDLRDGHPIELNLSLDAAIADVVRSGRATYGVPKGLEERLRKLQKRETP